MFVNFVAVAVFLSFAIDDTGAEGLRTARALRRKEHTMSLQRLQALRALLASEPAALAAYIVPTADAHNSEYISPTDARRKWVSGFTGSAGTAVVTAERALLWTDGRYYTQFDKEVDPALWTLMKQSLPDTPTKEKWLASNLERGAVVGADPTTMKWNEWKPLKKALLKANMQLVAVHQNLVDLARASLGDPAPPRPSNPLSPLSVNYTGKPAGEKIAELREKMKEKKASALVVTALDEVAYVLNLRGTDIQYNPVFFSFLVIRPEDLVLFWHQGQLPGEVLQHLASEKVEGLRARPYGDVLPFLENLAKELHESGGSHSIWLSHDASQAVHTAAVGGEGANYQVTLTSEVSPVALMKLVKNDVELQGFRDCHVRDGIAVVRFFRWLHQAVASGEVTEVQAADKLLEFRKDEADFMGPSFETIPGAGPNGAIIHYAPSREGPQTVIQRDHMFLLDSGGQYKDGTTDITRSRHMSAAPTPAQRDAFTRVLKGQIQLGAALFPKGVKGNVLDSFARASLWDVGLDYGHGTGHGVGHFLNVHEGPSGVSWRPCPDDPGLRARQVLSNEPGYYQVGEYGIRHEDLVETIDVDNATDHPKAGRLLGDFGGLGVLGFSTLTLVPNQRACIDPALLTDFELEYTNAYHRRVLEILGPILQKRGLQLDYQWLVEECRPIARG